MPKPKKSTTPPAEQLASDIDELALCDEAVRKMVAKGDYQIALVSHRSWLRLNIARTQNELAKIDERAEKRLRLITWPQAVAWCRRLSDAEWSRLVREVEGARGGRGNALG